MNFFKKTLVLALISLSALVLNSRAYSAGDYGLSCTNLAYGTRWIFTCSTTGTGTTIYGVYTGLDCVIQVVKKCKSSAIVGGEIARLELTLL